MLQCLKKYFAKNYLIFNFFYYEIEDSYVPEKRHLVQLLKNTAQRLSDRAFFEEVTEHDTTIAMACFTNVNFERDLGSIKNKIPLTFGFKTEEIICLMPHKNLESVFNTYLLSKFFDTSAHKYAINPPHIHIDDVLEEATRFIFNTYVTGVDDATHPDKYVFYRAVEKSVDELYKSRGRIKTEAVYQLFILSDVEKDIHRTYADMSIPYVISVDLAYIYRTILPPPSLNEQQQKPLNKKKTISSNLL